MSHPEQASPQETVRAFYKAMGSGAAPAEIASLFAEDAEWEIPGDPRVVPWVGRYFGRAGVAEALVQLRAHTEPVSFEVYQLLAEEDTVVALGELITRIPATGRLIESAFAAHVVITDGLITRYRFLEDSWAVANAVRDITVC